MRLFPYLIAWTWLLVVLLNGAALRPLPAAEEASERRVAVTIDDGPVLVIDPPEEALAYRSGIVEGLIAALETYDAPAALFVIGKEIVQPPDGERLARRWAEAGVAFGNHSWAHEDFDATPLADFQAGVERTTQVLDALLAPETAPFFRAPYLREGGTREHQEGLRATLATLRLRNAPVTIDSGDWRFNAVYEEAEREGDAEGMAAVGATYVAHVFDALVEAEAQALRTVGRPVAHVLLLHANALNRDYLAEVLGGLDGVGYRFVSLDEALADPVFDVPLPPDPAGLPWLSRLEAAYPFGVAERWP